MRWLRPRRPTSPPSPDAIARAAGFSRIAGVDEAGRGSWAGPVIAAAVVLGPRRIRARTGDSKQLTPLQRERAYHAILASAADVAVGIVCAPEIDRGNILQANRAAMRQAVAGLAHPPELVLIDGNDAPGLGVPSWMIVDGDQKSTSIGCASIIAKVVRDRLMVFYHSLYSAYGFHVHKGYGTSLHAERLRAAGPCLLHRESFRPVAESIEGRYQIRLRESRSTVSDTGRANVLA